MSGIGDMITGNRARRQASLAEAAQAEQSKRIAEQAAQVAAVEKGQRDNAATGGGGLLAYVDSEEAIRKRLKDTLGG